ncbi:hypothetical protein G6045_24340 [Streptomyces sp. YC504]|uniref:Uncharacterized protein n=1 Tax=Streptomyces mesophilus TaxID=1775132 RepID=A0A6G4XNJ8_9ACTN|nr:hypothetical protein [Streptomyces mesophilus]NGO78762.1 hypothetical protein [Streptomyces mesophilus]
MDDRQRRVRRSPLLFTAPLVLLCLLLVVLGWEVVRGNIAADARAHWPWRLQLLDMEPLGSLLAVASGAVFARAQYARTVRPALGWRAEWVRDLITADEYGWRVGLVNGGQGTAVIESVDYRVVRPGADAGEWTDFAGALAQLSAAGVEFGTDYGLELFGAGSPLIGRVDVGTVRAGEFSKRFVTEVDALQLRLRVVDTVGDTHERIVDCLKGARLTRPDVDRTA